VVDYADLKDAAGKLPITSGNDSPLIYMFWVCTKNTQVEPASDEYAKQVRAAFNPVMKLTSDPNNMLSGSGSSYLTTLGEVSNLIVNAAQQPQLDDATANNTGTRVWAGSGRRAVCGFRKAAPRSDYVCVE
jgi:hypothetical protein